MPNISSYTLPQFTDIVKRSFIKAQNNLENVMRTAPFIVEQSLPKHTGDTKRIAERLQRNQYASIRDEGNNATGARVQYGYEKDLTITTVALEVSITKRMRDAGKNQDILDQVTSLTEVCPNRLDLDLSHRFTFAWATSYVNLDGVSVDTTTADGLAVISASHTLTGSATTYSTQITANSAFSKGSLAVAERSFVENSYNNLGEKVTAKPDVILTADDPDTINSVRELMKSTADITTSNSGTYNVYQAKYKHIMGPRIATTATGDVDSTKRRYWFLIDSGASDMNLAILNEAYLKTPMDGNNGEDFSSENWNYLSAMDYGIAVVTAKWIRWSKWDWS